MVMPIPRVVLNEPDDIHGGADPTELRLLGLRPEQVLDFSANLNPFGPSPAVRLAMQGASIDRYPDQACGELRHELAGRHGIGEERILVGNGSAELIWLTAVAYLTPGDRVLILGPAFGGYERAARLMGASVSVYRAIPEDEFLPPHSAFSEGIGALQPRLAFLASPNNPTGQATPPGDVFALAAQYPRTLFVFDEAYIDFVESSPRHHSPDPPANVLRLRSLTKAHGLAGLRLGYALGAPEVIAALRAIQPPWSVNALAQAAGRAALGDERHLRDSLARLKEAKAELVGQLRAARFAPVSSAVPFFLMPVGEAARVRSVLLRQGILVRDCTSFGLPEYIRVSTRRREENARLVAALVAAQAEVGSCDR